MKLISSATCNIKFVILGFFLLNINVLAAQNASVCPIETVTAVAPNSELRSTSHVNEVLFAPFARWNQLNKVKFADDQKATIQLTNMARSRVVMGNNLGFQIPEGATINGITLMMKGQSDLYQNIDEIEMYLLDRYGEVKGQNKKNTAKLQKAWSVDRDGKDKVWMYGSSTDTWGTSWTVADINSPDFGYQFQIRSITNDTIKISLDQISLQVDYTPAFSFCDSKCLTFHIDKFEQFGSYRWFVPDGFQMVSASTHNPTIDLKITTATYGLYQICVDVFNKDGSFAERCCRNILYQDCLSSVIKGNVWADHNDNKTKEPTDGSLANVVLVLYNSSGTPIDTTMSDVLGNYEFNKLAEGNYYIKSAILSDTRMILFSPLDPDTNSDITNVFGLGTTDLIHVDIAKIVSNIDFGYTPLVDIGDLVWEDSNYNGLQDGSELGIKDVKIYLLDNNGIKLDSTLTNVDGQYAFSKIPANRYKLKFGISDPYFATFKNNTNNNKNSKIDSLGNTAAFNIFKGTKSDIDAGLYRFAAVGDQVWEDKNGDGIFNNTHEAGVAGVILRLTGQTGNGASVSKTITTDDQGNYIFDKLFPGVYNINVTLPTGFFETFPNIGDDVSDSDMVGGQISNVQLVSGQNAKEWDAGIYRKASLGDFVWEDVNGNGLQDSGEPGIGDIQVSLFKDSATVALATASTNASGFYLFNDLIPGN